LGLLAWSRGGGAALDRARRGHSRGEPLRGRRARHDHARLGELSWPARRDDDEARRGDHARRLRRDRRAPHRRRRPAPETARRQRGRAGGAALRRR